MTAMNTKITGAFRQVAKDAGYEVVEVGVRDDDIQVPGGINGILYFMRGLDTALRVEYVFRSKHVAVRVAGQAVDDELHESRRPLHRYQPRGLTGYRNYYFPRVEYHEGAQIREVLDLVRRLLPGLPEAGLTAEQAAGVLGIMPFARLANALDVARLHANTAEDPQWIIDQMIRALCGADREGEPEGEYAEFLATMERRQP